MGRGAVGIFAHEPKGWVLRLSGRWVEGRLFCRLQLALDGLTLTLRFFPAATAQGRRRRRRRRIFMKEEKTFSSAVRGAWSVLRVLDLLE